VTRGVHKCDPAGNRRFEQTTEFVHPTGAGSAARSRPASASGAVSCSCSARRDAASYVAALLERWPDIDSGEGDESPWSVGPLISDAIEPFFYFPMVWSMADGASEYASQLAAKYGLVCFDPPPDAMAPGAESTSTSDRTSRGRWRSCACDC
jgi:hypothetical protein